MHDPGLVPLCNEVYRIPWHRGNTGMSDYQLTITVNAAPGSGADFNTIVAALRGAQTALLAGSGVRICVEPGTYREVCPNLRFPGAAFDAPLLIEGGPGAVLSGFDPVDPKSWEDLGGGLYRTALGEAAGFRGDPWFPVENEIGIRSEQVFVDGSPLLPVSLESWDLQGFWNVETPAGQREDFKARYRGSLDPTGEIHEGSFGIAEEEGNWLYLRLPGLRSPALSLVELSRRSHLLSFESKSNLAIRGMGFRGAAGFPKQGLESALRMCGRFENLLIEDCAFEWNSAFGLNLGPVEGLTISRCSFSNNGFGGLGLDGAHNVLIEDCELSHNDWRNRLGGAIDRSHCTAGMKAHRSTSVLVRGCVAAGNGVNGLWFDIDCADVEVIDSACVLNRREGLFFEFSPGPARAIGNILAQNGSNDYIVDVVGVSMASANILYNTGNRGLGGAASGGIAIGQGMRHNEHATGQLAPGLSHRLSGNLVCVGPGGRAALGMYNRVWAELTSAGDLAAYERFPKSLALGENRWYVSGSEPFIYEDLRSGETRACLDMAKDRIAGSAQHPFVDPERLDFGPRDGNLDQFGPARQAANRLEPRILREWRQMQAWLAGEGWEKELR
jgi:hypothetical protein